MIIYNEKDEIVDITKVENVEQEQAREYIKPDDVVLELGARYGSVSCLINKTLKNKNNQVVVETDCRVWDVLERNRDNNNCEFNIVKGFISNNKLSSFSNNFCFRSFGHIFSSSCKLCFCTIKTF